MLIPEKDAGEPVDNLLGYFEQVHQVTGAGGTLHLKIVAVIKVEHDQGPERARGALSCQLRQLSVGWGKLSV